MVLKCIILMDGLKFMQLHKCNLKLLRSGLAIYVYEATLPFTAYGYKMHINNYCICVIL